MKMRQNQTGSMNILLIPLIFTSILLVGSLGFGVWAYTQRQSYKNDSDAKSEAAVTVAVKKAESTKDNEFLQKEKEPLKSYSSAAQYGSFSFKYPKTWSATVSEATNQLTLLGQPDVVTTGGKDTTYAVRVEVINTPYSQMVTPLDGAIKQGKITADSYSLPMVPDVVGLRVDGQIANNKTGAAVYLPLRDKTIKISCETQDRLDDFDDIILANFTFNP